MLWQIKKDFLSLFTRDGPSESYFHPVDGLRAIAHISIVLLHLIMIISSVLPPDPHPKWKEFVYGSGFNLMGILQLALETFFMLSGFLLAYRLIDQWDRSSQRFNGFLRKEYPLSILKRALRFWPGMLLATLLIFIFDEPAYPSGGHSFHIFRYISVWGFFQNYVDSEYTHLTLIPLWTNSLDMQAHIILPLFLYLFYSWRKYVSLSNSLILLLVIFVIRGFFVYDSDVAAGLLLIFQYPTLQAIHPTFINRWVQTHYNLTMITDFPGSNLPKLYTKRLYFPLEARLGSFIVGAIVACQLLKNADPQNRSIMNRKRFLILLSPLLLLTVIQSMKSLSAFEAGMLIQMIYGRPITAIFMGFILFASLCPSSHRFHINWIRHMHASPIWIPVSKLSYFVYLVHWRLSFELIFAGPLKFLLSYPVTQASLMALPIVLVICQVISCIWYVLIEKPIERVLKSYLPNDSHISKKQS